MINYTEDYLNSKKLHSAIATRLHNERISAKYTLDELAEKLNYSKPTVQSWEKGWKEQTGKNRIPTLEQLLDLSTLYHCTPEYLLCEYDCKSQQVTDICLETGLLPENATKLKNMFNTLLENPYGGGANDLFLSFLNYFIANIEPINELIFNRQLLAQEKHNLEEDDDNQEIIDGFNMINTGKLSSIVFNDGVFSNHVMSIMHSEELKKYYISKGHNTDRANELVEKFKNYYDILATNKQKQSDFAISDSFLDIVKNFFAMYPEIIYGSDGYNAYVAEQREQISPKRIKSPEIIRAK